jgi:hypothetical protein
MDNWMENLDEDEYWELVNSLDESAEEKID